MSVLTLNSLRDTKLWNLLTNSFSGKEGELAVELGQNLLCICGEANDRMKAFPSLHQEYTLHDQTHLLRVTELMSKVISDEVMAILNPVEIAFLILIAHFHDQGMVLDKVELDSLRSGRDFQIFENNWELNHPNLTDAKRRLLNRTLSGRELLRSQEALHDLRAALLTDYVRQTHGERSKAFVQHRYGNDPRWVVVGSNVAEFVGRLCLSHVKPARDLSPANGFRVDESIGSYQVNMQYLGLVLRLADILDFDRDRTPDSLYRTIDFRSHVSLGEWAKHRSVDGWVITPELVQFTMRCEHPEYQRSAYEFMSWIDKELSDSHAMIRTFPTKVAAYKLSLPNAVDRSRIEPKDNAYIFADLEFSLSRNEIVKLLLTENLYDRSWLCVRELLQNSLDALRHRKALIFRDSGVDWPLGNIVMTHELDKYSHEVIICQDNGVGMDRGIIQNFLTRVGRSYYRSPEFNQERESFKKADADFDPCAQFGIGFMSCFMFGDRILIETRRDNGPDSGKGEPLIVEINGLGGILVIRRGNENQAVGTIVKITGRKKPGFIDKWTDKANLVDVIKGYALACEFPIEARCTIPEIKESTSIPATVATYRTSLEKAEVKLSTTFEQKFSGIDPRLNGTIRLSIITSEDGRLVMENSEAKWRVDTEAQGEVCLDVVTKEKTISLRSHEGNRYSERVSLDGIFGMRPARKGRTLSPQQPWVAKSTVLLWSI